MDSHFVANVLFFLNCTNAFTIVYLLYYPAGKRCGKFWVRLDQGEGGRPAEGKGFIIIIIIINSAWPQLHDYIRTLYDCTQYTARFFSVLWYTYLYGIDKIDLLTSSSSSILPIHVTLGGIVLTLAFPIRSSAFLIQFC